MAASVPSIEPNDGLAITPDITASALAPGPPEPDVRKFSSLLGEDADARHVALVGLFALAVLYTLHLAQAFILPIVLAVLLDFLLSPIVRWFKRFRIPEPIGGGIVMLTLIAVTVVAVYGLSGPAAKWMARAPTSFATVQAKLQKFRQPMQQVSDAASQVEQATVVPGAETTQKVEIKGPSLVSQLFGGTASFLGAAMTVAFLTYFLLAAGDLFLQKLVTVLPQFQDKKKAVRIARETEAQISVYLFTSTLINLAVGIVTWGALSLVGMPNPVLWGVIAAVLNFVPYVGAVVNMAILALASLVTFETTSQALIPPAIFLGINIIEGNLVTPMILGKRMRLNTVALFIGFVFWLYLWGIAGGVLAVPMMATFKILCDHIESLASIGEFLGD